MSWSGTRRRLLALAGLGALGSLGRLPAALGATPLLSRFSVDNGGHPFAGDTGYLTTLGPSSGRTAARLRFALARPSTVTLEVLQTGQGAASEKPVAVGQSELSALRVTLGRGEHALEWKPPATLPARTYILRVSAQPRHSRRSSRRDARGRAGARRRRGVRRAHRESRRHGRSLPANRRVATHAADDAKRTGNGPDLLEQRPQRRPRRKPDPDRLADVSQSAGRGPGPARPELGHRHLLRTAAGGRRSHRVRADRPPSARADAARRRRHADLDVGGLQLLRRERRRLGRHVVRALEDELRRRDTTASESRHPLPLSQLRPPVPALARPDRARTSTRTATRTSRRSRRPTPSAPRTT